MHRYPHGGVEGEERGVHRDPVLPRSTVHPDVRLEEGNGHTVGQVQKDLDPVVARERARRSIGLCRASGLGVRRVDPSASDPDDVVRLVAHCWYMNQVMK